MSGYDRENNETLLIGTLLYRCLNSRVQKLDPVSLPFSCKENLCRSFSMLIPVTLRTVDGGCRFPPPRMNSKRLCFDD